MTMTARRTERRKIVMQNLEILRWNPETRQVDEYELTCQAGMALTEYRALGLTERDFTGELNLFDPYEDDWCYVVLDEWTEVITVQLH